MINCKELNKHIKSQELSKNRIEYSDIFKDPEKQKEITSLFSKILKIKNDKNLNSHPSTLQYQICSAEDLLNVHQCIDG